MNDFNLEASIIDADGNTVSVGQNSNLRGVVNKRLSNGVTLWEKTSDCYSYPCAVIVDETNYVVVGADRVNQVNCAMIVKFSGDGEVLWEKNLYSGGRSETLYAICKDSYGYVAVGVSGTKNNEYGALIVRFDVDGNLVYRKKLGKEICLDSISAVSDGNYRVTGRKIIEGFGREAFTKSLDESLNFV